MGFVEAVKSAFSRIFDFKGRSSRSEYWWFYLFTVIVAFVLGILMGAGGDSIVGMLGMLLYGLFILAILIPSLSLSFRRMHDKDMSAWLLLVGLVPIIGLILIYWFVTRGTVGPNKYGPDPLGGEAEVFA